MNLTIYLSPWLFIPLYISPDSSSSKSQVKVWVWVTTNKHRLQTNVVISRCENKCCTGVLPMFTESRFSIHNIDSRITQRITRVETSSASAIVRKQHQQETKNFSSIFRKQDRCKRSESRTMVYLMWTIRKVRWRLQVRHLHVLCRLVDYCWLRNKMFCVKPDVHWMRLHWTRHHHGLWQLHKAPSANEPQGLANQR